MTALGVFSFSCFLLSTAAEPCAAWISWCLQKALEMSRVALNTHTHHTPPPPPENTAALRCHLKAIMLERRGWDQGITG